MYSRSGGGGGGGSRRGNYPPSQPPAHPQQRRDVPVGYGLPQQTRATMAATGGGVPMAHHGGQQGGAPMSVYGHHHHSQQPQPSMVPPQHGGPPQHAHAQMAHHHHHSAAAAAVQHAHQQAAAAAAAAAAASQHPGGHHVQHGQPGSGYHNPSAAYGQPPQSSSSRAYSSRGPAPNPGSQVMQQTMYGSGPQVMQPAMPQYAPPKKYTLARPDRKPLSDALDVPGFYPLEPKAGEELFLRHCIGGGYYEPMAVNNEFGTMRTLFFPKSSEEEMEAACFSMKAQLLKHINEANWMMKCRPRKDLSSFQALKERKSAKTRSNKIPVLFPIQHKEQFIQSLADAEPLHLLLNRVPHGYRNNQLLEVLAARKVPLLRATWYIKIVQLNNNRQKAANKRNRVNASEDWTKTIIDYLFDLLNERHSSATSAVQASKHILSILRFRRKQPATTASVTTSSTASSATTPATKMGTPLTQQARTPLPATPSSTTATAYVEEGVSVKTEPVRIASIVADAEKETTVNEEESKLDAWYSKFAYITKLINWNFTERLVLRKMFLDRLVEKLMSYTSSSSSSSSADAKTSALDDQSLILSIAFNYLYDLCKWKPRAKRLVRYCIATLSKLSSELGGEVPSDWESRSFLYKSVSNVLRYAIQVVPPDVLYYIDKELLVPLHTLQLSEHCNFPIYSRYNRLLHEARANVRSPPSYNSTNLTMATVVELLDSFGKPGVSVATVYRRLFPSWCENSLTPIDTGTDPEIIKMICRWATTRHRKEVPYRVFTAAAVLRRHCDIVERKTKRRPQLQDMFLALLEKDRSDEEGQQVVMFFGELIRHGLFSHDVFVRHLIALGVFEPSWTDQERAERYKRYLRDIPLPGQLRHENNQRRVVLFGLNRTKDDAIMAVRVLKCTSLYLNPRGASSSPFQYPPLALLNQERESTLVSEEAGLPFQRALLLDVCRQVDHELTESLQGDSERLKELFSNMMNSTPRYYLCLMTEWLASCVRSCFSPNRNTGGWICSDVELQQVFVVLDQVQDFHSLVRLVLFLVSCVPATSLVPLLAVAKDHEGAFVSQNCLTSLLDVLGSRRLESLPNERRAMEVQVYLQSYMAELLSRYAECEEVISWLQEKQLQKSDFMAISAQQLQEGSPSFAMMHKTPVTPRMSPKTPLGHSAEETLNLILDSLNVWTLQLTSGHLLEWMSNLDRSSFASAGHELPGGCRVFLMNRLLARLLSHNINTASEEMSASVFGQLICLLGVHFEKDFFRHVQTILENRDALLGAVSFHDYLASVCADSGVDSTTFKSYGFTNNDNSSNSQAKANMQVQEAFIEMVTPSLLQTTTEQKQIFVQSLTNQLRVLLQNDRMSTFSLVTDPNRLWMVKQSLWMRLRFIIALLPLLVKKENRIVSSGINCKYFDDLVLTLFKFFGKTFLLIDGDDDLFRELMDLVHALVHNYGEELISASSNAFAMQRVSGFGTASGPSGTSGDDEEDIDDSSISSTLRQRLREDSKKMLSALPDSKRKLMKRYFPFLHQRSSNSNVVRITRFPSMLSTSGGMPQSPHTPSSSMSPSSALLSPLSPSVLLGGGPGSAPTTVGLDPWMLLEDWEDTPLAPSTFGGSLMPRHPLTYAASLFDEDGMPLYMESPVLHFAHPSHHSGRKRGWEEASAAGTSTSTNAVAALNQTLPQRPTKRMNLE